jgi:hypothetical protein
MAVFSTSVHQKLDTFAIGNRSTIVKHEVSELHTWPHLVKITAGIERDTRTSFFKDLFFTENTANYNVFVYSNRGDQVWVARRNPWPSIS